jgi:hypothetical protein
MLHRVSDRDHAGYAGAVVGNPWPDQTFAIAANFGVGSFRKYSIDVSGNHEELPSGIGTLSHAGHVSDFICSDVGQSGSAKPLCYPLGTGLFSERRSGDLS